MNLREAAKRLPAPIQRPLQRLWRWWQRGQLQPLEELSYAPDLFRAYRRLDGHPELQRVPGGWRYKGKVYPDYITVGGASPFIFREAQKVCCGRGVDIGAGFCPLAGAIPLDAVRGPGAGASIDAFADGSLDFVFSSHCLEHIEQWRDALAMWVRKLKPNGIIFLYLPHPDCGMWQPGSPFVGDAHKWVPTPEVIKRGLRELKCQPLQWDDGPDTMYSFFVCAHKLFAAEAD